MNEGSTCLACDRPCLTGQGVRAEFLAADVLTEVEVKTPVLETRQRFEHLEKAAIDVCGVCFTRLYRRRILSFLLVSGLLLGVGIAMARAENGWTLAWLPLLFGIVFLVLWVKWMWESRAPGFFLRLDPEAVAGTVKRLAHRKVREGWAHPVFSRWGLSESRSRELRLLTPGEAGVLLKQGAQE